MVTALANPARSYAFDLSSPLGIPRDGAVDLSSVPGLYHLFPELAAVIHRSITESSLYPSKVECVFSVRERMRDADAILLREKKLILS